MRRAPPGGEVAFLHPLPVRALWGVGPATLARLERLGVRTVGDLADLPVDTLVGALGQADGRHLAQLARGIDPRPVEPDQQAEVDRPRGDVRRTTTTTRPTLEREVVRMADARGVRGCAGTDQAARTVTIKVRFGDFRTITRSITLPAPVDDGSGDRPRRPAGCSPRSTRRRGSGCSG